MIKLIKSAIANHIFELGYRVQLDTHYLNMENQISDVENQVAGYIHVWAKNHMMHITIWFYASFIVISNYITKKALLIEYTDQSLIDHIVTILDNGTLTEQPPTWSSEWSDNTTWDW